MMFDICTAWDGTRTIIGRDRSYHQRTDLPESEVKERDAIARKQDAEVVEFLRTNGPHDPERAWEKMKAANPDLPLGNVRRSMTNLTDRGILVKGGKVEGPHGHCVHVWKLPKQ